MDKCVFCGGKILEERVTFVYDDDDKYFFVEHVPAEVCTKCGERTYSPEVTEDIIKFAKCKIKPSKTVEVPVFDFVEKV
ncbi:MAG: YgiT-type zinc finger protein [Nitrospirae bacterium]|nr:YgiT-type zinc finger protein [Nitrospirota bacterium]